MHPAVFHHLHVANHKALDNGKLREAIGLKNGFLNTSDKILLDQLQAGKKKLELEQIYTQPIIIQYCSVCVECFKYRKCFTFCINIKKMICINNSSAQYDLSNTPVFKH